jgi:hypothetical protein
VGRRTMAMVAWGFGSNGRVVGTKGMEGWWKGGEMGG